MADDLLKFFNKAFKKIEKQVAYASVLAANSIAADVKTGVERQLKTDIDRPTPFTQKAFKVTRANKTTLAATVSIKPLQANYLKYQIEGGTRRAKSLVIPRKKAKNKYGNLPKGKLSKLSSQGKTYVADGLVIQQMKTKTKPLAYLTKKSATYKQRFKFFERGHSTAKKVAKLHVKSAIRKALATAR